MVRRQAPVPPAPDGLSPPASSPAVRDRMSRQRSRDTAPELALRRELWSRGLRYRVQHRAACLPRRTIDVAFPRDRVAVFVDGCFWHGCPAHSRPTKSNSGWWAEKIRANGERDADTVARLEADGWTVVRAWEHEDPVAVADGVLSVLIRIRVG